MPLYDFRCSKCDTIKEDVVLPITHRSSEKPRCCNETMNYFISTVPMVMWKDPNIEPFRAVGTKDAPIISSMKENREYMARNGLVDANDLYDPPTQAQQQEAIAEAQASIDAITPNAQQAEQIKKMGLDTIVEGE